jgi:hypothetical protein
MWLDLLGTLGSRKLLKHFWRLPMQAFPSGLPFGDGVTVTVENLRNHAARAKSDGADLRQFDSGGLDCKAAWIPQQLAMRQAPLQDFLMIIAATPS